MGGGVGVSVHGDFRVAGNKTTFAMPETGIGFHPDVGGHYFLPRLSGEIGTWMGLTGARLKAADCLASGVATHYVPSDKHAALLDRLETTELDDDGEAVEAILAEFSGDPGVSDLALHLGLINAAFEGDDLAEIVQRLRAAGDVWSMKQADIIASKSPTSCVVTLAALRRGAELSLRDVMVQDLRLSMRFLDDGSDFYEGVRAVIVDKDNSPNWAIKTDDANAYFAPLSSELEMSFLD
jgi:enoyl-CoA hydratase